MAVLITNIIPLYKAVLLIIKYTVFMKGKYRGVINTDVILMS